MAKERTIKLIWEKGKMSIDSIDNVPVFLREPFSTKEVNMWINPDITESKDVSELRGIQAGRVTVLGKHKEKTTVLKFDFKDNQSHKITFNEKAYLIKLNKIENTKDKQRELMTYEFALVET